MLTINNPLFYDLTHDNIKNIMMSLNCVYWCMCDEIGLENKTPHTHLYFTCENAISFNRVKKLFPSAHIDKALGSSQENRDYIRKEGKYETSDKKETNLIDTFEEFGSVPLDVKQNNDKVSSLVFDEIKQGYTNAQILELHPSYLNKIDHINKARETLRQDEQKSSFRNLYVAYIYGPSRCGKTSFVMNGFGYDNVYRVSNYKHPFDTYNGQDVLLLDEFNSQLDFELILQLTDGYPFALPSRYSDKTACFTKIFFISNLPFEKQYQYIDNEQWVAFCRRFNSILKFGSKGYENAEGFDPSSFEHRKVYSYV